MACYTANLVSGDNLLCTTLKTGTILRYLNAAAEFSLSANITNPCLDTNGKQSKYVKDILNEVKRWETVPNRREPVTNEIIDYLYKKGTKISIDNPNNLYSALSDWLILGHQSGFRRKEWAQDRSYINKHNDFQRNVDGSPAAFTLTDFEFRTKNNKRISQNNNREIQKASIVNVKWRYQKNNDNGQIISYIEDTVNKHYCYVSACKRIRLRAIKMKQDINKPIAIFNSGQKGSKIAYIDDIHINTFLQEAAKNVYNITKKEELNRFTSHSIRVGACVLLHSQNISSEDIKFRLRWRSDSFRMYLRNVVQLAQRHKNEVANTCLC
jgi:hypothetical protein